MKRTLLILAALILAAPQAAIAESVWLVLRLGGDKGDRWRNEPVAMEKIQMNDMDQCEEQGAHWMSSQRISNTANYLGFECIEGK